MAQWIRIVTAQPNDPSSMPRTHMVGELIPTSCFLLNFIFILTYFKKFYHWVLGFSFIYFYVYVCVPCACRSPQRLEEDNGYPGTGVIGGRMDSGNQTGVLCMSMKSLLYSHSLTHLKNSNPKTAINLASVEPDFYVIENSRWMRILLLGDIHTSLTSEGRKVCSAQISAC